MTGFAAGFGGALRGAVLRAGLADLAGRWRDACDRLALELAALAGLRLDDLRGFTARRNFAMPGA